MAALFALGVFLFVWVCIDIRLARRRYRRDAWLAIEQEAESRRRLHQALHPDE